MLWSELKIPRCSRQSARRKNISGWQWPFLKSEPLLCEFTNVNCLSRWHHIASISVEGKNRAPNVYLPKQINYIHNRHKHFTTASTKWCDWENKNFIPLWSLLLQVTVTCTLFWHSKMRNNEHIYAACPVIVYTIDICSFLFICADTCVSFSVLVVYHELGRGKYCFQPENRPL